MNSSLEATLRTFPHLKGAYKGCLLSQIQVMLIGLLCLLVSADGKRLASASGDKTIKVWNCTDGNLELTLEGHAQVFALEEMFCLHKGISDVAWSSDSRYLASASDDMFVKLWDAMSVRSIRHWLSEGTLCEDSQGPHELCVLCRFQPPGQSSGVGLGRPSFCMC
jgi:WD40 repeat protein